MGINILLLDFMIKGQHYRFQRSACETNTPSSSLLIFLIDHLGDALHAQRYTKDCRCMWQLHLICPPEQNMLGRAFEMEDCGGHLLLKVSKLLLG